MRLFKSNRILYFILPVIITSIILMYMLFLFGQSYTWINVVNISVDVIILVYYVMRFVLGIGVDDKRVVIRTAFRRYTLYGDQIRGVVHTSFLTKVSAENINFYIITSPRERDILGRLLKDIKKIP